MHRYSVDIFHILVVREYWVLAKGRQLLKVGACGRESCCIFNRLNEIKPSLFLDDPVTTLLRNDMDKLMTSFMINPFILMDFPIHIDAISMDLSILHFKGSHSEFSQLWRISALEGCISLSKSAHPDEMQQCAAFHQGLHCLPKISVYKKLLGV